jgi:4-hydroxy-tetrahydrodipicolinate reductase
MTSKSDRLRVVQWATGNVGRHAMREVIRHPSLELVGALTYDLAKSGRDAGELCGELANGIKVTNDRAAIHALKADCVLYMPRVIDIEDLLKFAAAGTNVVSVCMELFDGARGLSETDRKRLQAECVRSGASVYGTGSSPGFIGDIFPYALLSVQRRVDAVEIEEYGNISQRDSPGMLFDQMGFGKPMGKTPVPRMLQVPPPLDPIARAAGWHIDKWTTATDFAAARETTQIVAGEVKAGTVGARRMIIVGQDNGREVLRFTQYMYATQNLDAPWEFGPTGWRVLVKGDAPLDVSLVFPIAVEHLNDHTPGYTANPAVNAVPFVCVAKAGILRTTDLPPLTPAGPSGHARTAASSGG